MLKHSLAHPLMACAVLLASSSIAAGQATPVTLPGLITNKLGMPLAPTASGSISCTGSTSNNYTVAALDFVGGSTVQGSVSNSVTCTPGTGSSYVVVLTQAVNGAQSCNVYRNAGATTGYIGNTACGGYFVDIGIVGGSGPPSTDTTGGIVAAGTVVAPVLSANGGASPGTDILGAGSPALTFCSSTQPPPCIPSTNVFFQQAPASITYANSWGVTWPSAPTALSSPPSSPLIGPFLFGALSTSPATNASNVAIGSLTNLSNYILATASSAPHAFTANDLASIAVSGSNVDFVDSGITLTGSPLKVPWDVIGNAQNNQSISMGSKTTIWNWSGTAPTADYVQWQAGNATAAKNFFDITDTATNNSATGSLLNVFTSSGSTMIPFTATAGGTNGVQLSNAGVLSKAGSGHVNADQCNGNNCPSYTGTPGTNDLAVWGAGGALLDDANLTDNGTTLQYAGAFAVTNNGAVSKYGTITTVRGGVPSLPSPQNNANVTGRNSAIGATTIYTLPVSATAQGLYRLCYAAVVTTKATTSSVLGGTNGFQVVYTDNDTGNSTTTQPGPTNNGNAVLTPGTQVNGCVTVNAKVNTAIQYSFGYQSSGTTVMVYALHIAAEALY
jgi:hypothetical protein